MAGGHRQKQDKSLLGVLNALVTRVIPAKDPEFHSPPCVAALKKELDDLRGQGVWDENGVTEWASAKADSLKKGVDATVGRLFAIMGEKGSELRRPVSERVYKARAVYAGNNIQTASGVAAHSLFQEVTQTPAAMMTVRGLLACAALRGYKPKVRDASQAYIQSRIDAPGRPKTWIRLPRAWWPRSWYNAAGEALFKDPVVPLCKALYGHPEAGALWDKHLGSILTDLGWRPVSAHPGLWRHPATDAFMAVYVDDILMAAPSAHEHALWQAIEKRVSFEGPTAPIGKFLGGHHAVTRRGDEVHFECSMRDFLVDAVEAYKAELGIATLPSVRTPYLMEDFVAKKDGEPEIGRAHV